MKKKFKISYLKIALVAFAMSIMFFILAFVALSESNYQLSNYSEELKTKYDFDYAKHLNFDNIFNRTSTQSMVNIRPEQKVKKIIIKAKASNINIFNKDAKTTDIFVNADVRKSSNSSSSLFDYTFLDNTNTALLTLNDDPNFIFESNIDVILPNDFKGELVIQSDDSTIINNSTNQFKLIQKPFK